MITIAIANQKGGVGKTTIAFNLAQILSKKRGVKVLAIDCDPQGNLTSSFLDDPTKLSSNILDAFNDKPIEPEKFSNSLYFVGANISLAPVAEKDFDVIFQLKESIEKLKRKESPWKFDYCIIDCLPSFGNLHMAALNAADYVLIPVKPAPYALSGMTDLFKTIDKMRVRMNPELKTLGIVINQVDGRKPILEKEMEEVLREENGDLVLKSKINKRVKVEESPMFQKSITEYDPKGPSAKEFKSVINEVLARLQSEN